MPLLYLLFLKGSLRGAHAPFGLSSLQVNNVGVSIRGMPAPLWVNNIGVFKRGVSPSLKIFPLSFQGEGDKGGEVT